MRTLITAIVVVTLGHAWPSRACECGVPNVFSPSDGAQGVPIDTLLWHSWINPERSALLDGSGARVDGAWLEQQIGVAIFAPAAPLASFATYELREYLEPADDVPPEELASGGTRVITFETGDALAGTPSAPSVAVAFEHVEAQTNDDCGPPGLRVGVGFTATHDALLTVALRNAAVLPETFDANVGWSATDAAGSLSFGNGYCDSGAWPAGPGDSAAFNFASVSVAGALSAWTTLEYTLPELPSEGEGEGEGEGEDDDDDAGGGATTDAPALAFIALIGISRGVATRSGRRASGART